MNRLYKEDVRLLVACAVLFAVVASVCVFVLECGKSSVSEHAPLQPTDAETLAQLQKQLEADTVQRHGDERSTHLAAHLFPFDPNHADSVILCKLGLSSWQVANMMKYRRKGGLWRSPDDFQRLYGLSSSDFVRLKPYVRIAKADMRGRYVPFDDDAFPRYPKGEVPQYEHVQKLQEGEQLSLNEADTTALKTVPGLGSYYARKIVQYRERLGGFINVRQLDAIEGLPSGISRWFRVAGNVQTKRLRINHATFKELVHHPYISYEQTKVIVNHIRSYGPLRSWRDLKLYKEFTEDDFQRLSPYVTFD